MADVSARRGLLGYRVARLAATHPRSRRRGFQLATGGFLWLVLASNAGATVWLWWRGGGVSSVHDTATLLISLGRVTGLLGAYLLLLQVLLVGRLPWLERLTGFDRLTVWHRRNGKICLYLILAHVLLITLGYALSDKLSVPAEVSTLLSSYPGMVTATVGTVLLITVVVTSLVIVRQRLRYEYWYLVHLMTYAGIALAWFHQIPTGNEFAVNPTAAAYWSALYVATLVLLVIYRLAQPVVRGFRHRLQVAQVTEERPGVVSLRITGRRLDRLGARPGQFFLWRFLSRDRWWESHPFSLSAAPHAGSFRITVKSSGDFSSRMREIAPGTRVALEGPFGVFTDAVQRRDRVVLIAGGIGITPIRALLEEMPGELALIYRALRDEDLVFREELEDLSRRRGVTIYYVVGDHAAPGGERLLSPEHLHELVPDIAKREVYICGPPAMMGVLEQNVRRASVPRKHIHTERFAL